MFFNYKWAILCCNCSMPEGSESYVVTLFGVEDSQFLCTLGRDAWEASLCSLGPNPLRPAPD